MRMGSAVSSQSLKSYALGPCSTRGESPVDGQELGDRRQPDRDARDDHCGYRGHRQLREICRGHQQNHKRLPGDIDGHHGEPDPVVAACNSLLDIGKRVSGYDDAGQIEGDGHVSFEPGLEQAHAARCQGGDPDGDSQCGPATAGQETAQKRERAALAVLRDEALRCCPEPEVDRLPDQHHPGPDIDVDAELEAAHPAREQHLRAESKQGAHDAN